MTLRKIDLLMYNTMRGKPNEETFFIREENIKRQVERKEIFNTIKHYYKLAHRGKIQLGENYYFNSSSHLVIKELYITPIE